MVAVWNHDGEREGGNFFFFFFSYSCCSQFLFYSQMLENRDEFRPSSVIGGVASLQRSRTSVAFDSPCVSPCNSTSHWWTQL